MKALLQRIFAHPLTSLTGAVIGASQLAVKLSSAGIHAGHFGKSDYVSVAGAIGAIILGALAKDK